MKHYILLAVFVCTALAAGAQVPGYMGKKHLFTYTPSLSIFTNSYRVDNTKLSKMFFLKHNVAYDYVIKKHKTIGLFYEYVGYNTYAGNDGRSGYQQYIYADYKKHQFGFNYRKYFRKGNLAPLGTYMKYSISVINATSTMKPESIPYYEAEYRNGDDYLTEIQTWDVAIGMGVGKQFVVAKYIPLNFAIDFQLPIGHLFSYPAQGLETSHLYTNLATSLISFNVGVGILAF